MARSTNEQNKTQNCNTRKASQKATQSTTQKTTNSTTDCGCGCGTKAKTTAAKEVMLCLKASCILKNLASKRIFRVMHRASGRGRTMSAPTERYLAV